MRVARMMFDGEMLILGSRHVAIPAVDADPVFAAVTPKVARGFSCVFQIALRVTRLRPLRTRPPASCRKFSSGVSEG